MKRIIVSILLLCSFCFINSTHAWIKAVDESLEFDKFRLVKKHCGISKDKNCKIIENYWIYLWRTSWYYFSTSWVYGYTKLMSFEEFEQKNWPSWLYSSTPYIVKYDISEAPKIYFLTYIAFIVWVVFSFYLTIKYWNIVLRKYKEKN